MLWLFLIVAGGAVLWGASGMSSAGGGPVAADAGEQMMSVLRSSGQDTSRMAIRVFGILLCAAGVVGLLRVWTTGGDVPEADPTMVHGLAGDRPKVELPPSLREAPAGPTADAWSEEIDFDPTRWEHPCGLILVVDGRSAGPLYDAVKSVARQAGISGPLTAMLQGLEQRERKLVVLLGETSAVERFEAAWTAWVQAGAGGDWDRVRPDLHLSAGTPQHDALRGQLRSAGFMVLAAERA